MDETAFGPVEQIDAGVLDVGHVDVGPRNGQPVMLLHGWPYDIHRRSGAARRAVEVPGAPAAAISVMTARA
jgi:pimeloyl-ACP methyl ester carboxylesterase